MALHLIKLAVGVEDFDHLADLQKHRIQANAERGLSAHPRHITRMTPRRQKEILDGGSIYWVIKGMISARQRVVAFEELFDEEGVRRCAFVLDPDLRATQKRPHRAFQGWRYLAGDKAPADAGEGQDDDLPPDLARDLGNLGLL